MSDVLILGAPVVTTVPAGGAPPSGLPRGATATQRIDAIDIGRGLAVVGTLRRRRGIFLVMAGLLEWVMKRRPGRGPAVTSR